MSDLKDMIVQELIDEWARKRMEEAATMCANRAPTEEEIERAMIIGKWFFGWNSASGPCPISSRNPIWEKKLCSLFEWIATLETEARKGAK